MVKKQATASQKKKFLHIFWGTAAGLFLCVILLFILIANGKFGFMPTFEYLENPNADIASEVYSSDGVLLTTFFLEKNRNPVEYKDLPPYLINALIAREDHRFVDHSGIDGLGLMRVAVKTVLLQKSGEGGGSTITQQLAKQLFERDTTRYNWGIAQKMHMATIKFREWVIAVRLEKQYTKQEIVTMYLNMVPFGGQIYGIKLGARSYFGKSVDSLRIEEAAMLVGMLQRPTYYNPVKHPERTTIRRNGVLSKMEENGFLSRQACDSLKQIPLQLNYERLDHETSSAPYFREYLQQIMRKKEPVRKDKNPESFRKDSTQWADDPLYGWCNKNLKPDKAPYNLYTDGLKIYTTIDSRMQKYAEEAMEKHMKEKQKEFFKEKKGRKKAPFSTDLTDKEIEDIMMSAMRRTERYNLMKNRGVSQKEILKKFQEPCEMTVFSWDGDKDTIMSPWDSIRYHKAFLRSSMMAMNPHTGEVKAYVGGINYRHFKYDGVTMQKRQVGSTFKPFLYTLAFQDKKDLTPCYKVLNVQQTFNIPGDTVPYAPKSSGNKKFFNKWVTLKWGLAASENNVTAWLLKQVSPAAVADMAHKMGITSYIDPVYSIVLGPAELSVAEMTAAYSVYPNGGVYSEPIFVTRIEDKNGNLLQRFNSYKEEAISAQTAYLMVNMLMGVVRGGTASRLRSSAYPYQLMNEIGGKTGTTQAHADGWFMGITPDLVTGVWVGGEERSIRFDVMERGQGASMALPIFGLFMKKVYADKKIGLTQGPFERPNNFNINLDCGPDQDLDGTTVYDE